VIRVVLVDDHEIVRSGLAAILSVEPDIEVVGQAGDGREGARRARESDADVVLMDVEMPGTGGIEGVSLVAQANPRTRVLMLTTFDLDEHVAAALDAGAVGYLLKTAGRHELAAAVRSAHAGRVELDGVITRRLVARFLRRGAAQGTPEPLRDLSVRELEVFGLIARGLSNAEIAAALTDSETTVKSHVARILAKTGLRDRVQAVVLAYESGFLDAQRDG
jgi:DNA-binding NarL/FixJ family response regulator